MKTAIELIREFCPTKPEFKLKMGCNRPVICMKDKECCPLGLIPGVRNFPGGQDFDPLTVDRWNIGTFYARWDRASLKEAKEIIKEIWPDEM